MDDFVSHPPGVDLQRNVNSKLSAANRHAPERCWQIARESRVEEMSRGAERDMSPFASVVGPHPSRRYSACFLTRRTDET